MPGHQGEVAVKGRFTSVVGISEPIRILPTSHTWTYLTFITTPHKESITVTNFILQM